MNTMTVDEEVLKQLLAAVSNARGEGDIYKHILAAQESYYTAISQVRADAAKEQKESRHELIEMFTAAHRDNLIAMERVAAEMRGTKVDLMTELKSHCTADDERFKVSNEFQVKVNKYFNGWTAIGGFLLVTGSCVTGIILVIEKVLEFWRAK